MPQTGLPLRFRPSWWGALLAAAACAAGIALGNWQSGRAEARRAAAAAAPITLRGAFVAGRALFLMNRLHNGRPGYYVLQPLRLADGRHVLVNRGWLAAGAGAGAPEAAAPQGELVLQGLRQAHPPRAFAPAGAASEGNVRQNVSIEEFSAWSGLALEPWILEQHSPLPDGLARDWPRPDAGAEQNESYALQWYSLAALAVILFLVLGFKRGGA